MSNLTVVLVTIALITLSAFFVAIEFALISAKRHRLEDAATRSRAARAALRSSSELTLLLAGSQLGITVCTLALGAITKPAVHHWLTPLFASWGMPELTADVVGFVLALIIVTFLHLVVGEMAPKSWAIAHPEKSATLLALPMRGFMWAFRPVLRGLNATANWCLRRVGVEPSDEVAAGQTSDDLRHLVEHSANVGALDASYSRQLSVALDLERLTVADLVRPGARLTAVPLSATVAEVQETARRSGHLRILLGDTRGIQGVVHVRDTLTRPATAGVADLARPVFTLAPTTTAYTALAHMRESRNHLAVVRDGDRVVGVITMSDVLRRLFPVVEAVER
ncbi:hemolysin family protein [Georgenia faecalis]|uniref:Hemolysin family protein n=1 Tax=Georgenia faecalis TaxID=2483799 RepID=A0ABV9D4J9_9MICO|nr:hemolysin family protein [Georgenia faecalis]